MCTARMFQSLYRLIMTTMVPPEARLYWKALMDNSSALIADAHLLLGAGSFGRARSLTVLAQEELGKAVWIYQAFGTSWSTGSEDAINVDELAKSGRDHVRKYTRAYVFGDELSMFWGDFDVDRWTPREGETFDEMIERGRREADEAASLANKQKQGGFYVDRDGSGVITTPLDVEQGSIPEDLQIAAQVVEMMLIKDHTRMKHDASTPYDSTHEQQFRLLPISHPEDWEAASDEFKKGVMPKGWNE